MSETNNLLMSLRPEDRAMLEEHLTEIELETDHIIYEPGDGIDHCYFPVGTSVGSFLVMLESGNGIEITMIGREGALGGIVSHGKLPAFARSCTIHGGKFLRIPTCRLEDAKKQSRSIEVLFARYADCLLAQVFQSVACNAGHTIEQRAAKWLCAAVERTGDNDVSMTQEQLASMMGVGRSYVSRIVKRYKQAGLVETRRGGIRVLDPTSLAACACACNDQVQRHFETVLEGLYPG